MYTALITKDVKKSRQKNEKVAADIWKVGANGAGNCKSRGISEKSRKNVKNRDRAIFKSINMANKTYLVLKKGSKKTSYVI